MIITNLFLGIVARYSTLQNSKGTAAKYSIKSLSINQYKHSGITGGTRVINSSNYLKRYLGLIVRFNKR